MAEESDIVYRWRKRDRSMPKKAKRWTRFGRKTESARLGHGEIIWWNPSVKKQKVYVYCIDLYECPSVR